MAMCNFKGVREYNLIMSLEGQKEGNELGSFDIDLLPKLSGGFTGICLLMIYYIFIDK